MLKKLMFALLILFLITSSSYADELKPEQKTYTIAFAQDTLANDWRLAQIKQFQQAFKKYPNVKFIYTDGEGETTKQIHDINTLMHQNIDLLITSPRNAQIMTPVIRKVHKKLPVVLVTRKIETDDFTAFISPDDYKIASDAAHIVAKALNKKGHVLMLRGVPTASTAVKRQQGFMDTIKKNYPNIIISSIKDGNYLRSDAIQAVDEAISEGVKFDAIYAHSDSMASGARTALKHAGIDIKSKLIVGIDYINEARQAIINNEQLASFLYPTCANEAAEVVMNILNNKPFKKLNVVESTLITKENVDGVKPIF